MYVDSRQSKAKHAAQIGCRAAEHHILFGCLCLCYDQDALERGGGVRAGVSGNFWIFLDQGALARRVAGASWLGRG